jgi:tetratricopeptide (TPR) repeat protein
MDGRAYHMSNRNGPRICASSVSFRQPQQHTKLRVALVCVVWGEEFADFFARYCVPSLLEPRNIPLVSREHDATLLLYTDRATQEFLDRCDSFKSLSRFAKVELLPLEQLPAPARTSHWVSWQHAVAGRNRDFDAFLLVIPDCVYAAGYLGTIVDALEEHDTVYGTLPQVCRETVAAELDGLRRVDDHEYISFTSLQAVELFIRHVNPKHAAAACSSTFFVNHPEIAIKLSPNSMVVSETGSHPFAIRSSIRRVSYTLDALSPEAKTCYLEILGVSAEPALKFVEEYYRWPKLFRNHSRLMNLGRWACLFRGASAVAYSKSAIHITLDQGRVLEQHRGQVKCAKTRFINATLDWLAVATRLYERARECPDAAAAKYIALAMAAPGFHRHLCRLQSGFTVVLPNSESGFGEVVKRIERHPAATEILRRFLFLHVVAGQLPIVPGHAIFLTYSDAADDFPKAFVVDPHTVALGAGLWAKSISPLQWVWDKVFSIEAEIDYGHLTWSMLDPLHGTSERVLDHSVSTDAIGDVEELHNEVAGADPPDRVLPADRGSTGPDDDHALVGRAGLHAVTEGASSRVAFTARSIANFGIVKACVLATKLALQRQSAWLVRNRYRKGKGRPRLSVEAAGINPPVLRLAGPEARESPAEPELSISRRPPLTESARASYDAICKLNIADNVAKITLAFYERLGLNPQQSPVYRCLQSVRSKLAEEVEAQSAISTQSSLERFELAWRAYEAGKIHEALQLFGEVIADQDLAAASEADPRAREAFIRAAEILGRHAELRGDTSAAADLYRRILELDGNGNAIVARRLLLTLWREARIQEAAELAPRAVLSDGNLTLHLRGSDAVNDLARRLGRESRCEATTAGGQDARDSKRQDRCAARTVDDLEQAYR